jgi:hypothetical protein
MPATARHRAAETRFLTLLDEAEVRRPDRVDYEPDSLIFYWDESKTAVVVELTEPAAHE